MAKRVSVYLLSAALFLSMGCRALEMAETEGTVIGATIEGSRTVLDGTKVLWTAADGIVVNGALSSSTTVRDGGRNAEFSFSGTLGSPYYALYPSSRFIADSYIPAAGSYGSITLPREQAWTEGSFDPSAAVMYGTSADTPDVNFHLGAAFIRFTVSGGGYPALKRIEISSLGDEDMSGTLVLKSGPVLELSPDTHTGGVTVRAEEGIPAGAPVMAAIAPQTYASGIRVRLVDMENHFQDIRSTKTFSAVAGTVYNTSVTFAPTGTLVEGATEAGEDGGELPSGLPLKILFIGNSHTVDATDLLPFMLNSAGVRNVEITRTYHGGYYLVGYNTNYAQPDICSIMTWKSGQMRMRGVLTNDHSLKEAVEAGPYDIVVLQEYAGSSYCWDWSKDNFAERAAVQGLISKIKAFSPDVKLYYYLSHTFGTGNSSLIKNFNDDNVLQFNTCIEGNARHMMDPEEGFGFEHMISTAALMQNLRTSALNIDNGKDLFRGDALHMDYGAVRYAGSCLLWKTLLEEYTGIDYRDVPFRYREFYPSASAYTTPVTDGNIAVLHAAVEAAYAHPMEITDLSGIPVDTEYADDPGATTMDLTGVDFEPATWPVDFNMGFIGGVAQAGTGPQPYWLSHGVWVGAQSQCFAKWISVSRPRQDIVYSRTTTQGTESNNLSSPKVQGVWTGDYMEFVIPVRNFAAGTTVNLYIPMYVDHAPVFWYVDYLDGGVWKCDHSEKTSYGDSPYTRDCTVALNYKLNSLNVKMTFANAVPEGYLRFRVRCADGTIQYELQPGPVFDS